jgi:hypothetical protein
MPYEEHDDRETDLDLDEQPNFFDEDPAEYTDTYFAERLDIEETETETFEDNEDLDDVMTESSPDNFGETVDSDAESDTVKEDDHPSQENDTSSKSE